MSKMWLKSSKTRMIITKLIITSLSFYAMNEYENVRTPNTFADLEITKQKYTFAKSLLTIQSYGKK
jgi:hypothetical protein